jgi:hypothetical protein
MGPTMHITKKKSVAGDPYPTRPWHYALILVHIFFAFISDLTASCSSSTRARMDRVIPSLEDASGRFHPHRVSIFKFFKAKSSAPEY